jgi:adenylylsulfate kinase
VRNLVWHSSAITREVRQARNKHRGVVVWFTGLSGSGKSTLAHALEQRLFDLGCQTVVLDGDNVRHGLCSDLTFSEIDRHENIRRIGEVSKLFAETGLIAITAFISPFRTDRERVRGLMPHGDFFEVYVECPLEVCEARDVKGFYEKARTGKIAAYTGISSPYEPPERPEFVVNTSEQTQAKCVENLIQMLICRGVIDITRIQV